MARYDLLRLGTLVYGAVYAYQNEVMLVAAFLIAFLLLVLVGEALVILHQFKLDWRKLRAG